MERAIVLPALYLRDDTDQARALKHVALPRARDVELAEVMHRGPAMRKQNDYLQCANNVERHELLSPRPPTGPCARMPFGYVQPPTVSKSRRRGRSLSPKRHRVRPHFLPLLHKLHGVHRWQVAEICPTSRRTKTRQGV